VLKHFDFSLQLLLYIFSHLLVSSLPAVHQVIIPRRNHLRNQSHFAPCSQATRSTRVASTETLETLPKLPSPLN
jgi:hypothetical protein